MPWTRRPTISDAFSGFLLRSDDCHEQMHRTREQETASPPQRTFREQPRAFDRFRRCFNEEQPHVVDRSGELRFERRRCRRSGP